MNSQHKMNIRTTTELLLLAAIWGSSFMFMRIGVPEFGPVLFTALRTGIAALFLFSCLLIYRQSNALAGRWRQIFIVGTLNTAIPFAMFSYATLTLTAGVTSVLNATTPMFGAIVAYFWLKDKLSVSAIIGLIIGFVGVYFLVSDSLSIANQVNTTNQDEYSRTILSTLAAMLAALCYGISANYTKKHFAGIKPLALAAGSQISASIILIPMSLFYIPAQLPSMKAITSVLFIGIVCTGLAYILFFKLIAQLGPARTISVTYLIPAFGIVWGAIFLNETISISMILGCGIILFGVALTTGILKRK